MVKILYKITGIIILVFVLTLTGCLKDSNYNNNTYGINPSQNENFVEIHLTTSDNSNLVSRAYSLLNKDTTVTDLIPVHLTSGPAPSDIKVSFELLDTINSAIVDTLVHHGDFVPDSSKIKVVNPGMMVTIPKGSSTGYVAIKFNPSNLIGNTYVFGIRLTSVSNKNYTISNLDTGFVQIGIKNQWDGTYSLNGWILRAGDPAKTGYISNVPWVLNTVNKNTVIFALIQIWADNSQVGGIGPWQLSIDDSGGPNNPMPVTVSDAQNPAVTNNPNYNSRYEPSSKTFFISVYWGAGPASRAAVDTLIYQGPSK